jgi:hypothetical protein
LRFLWFAAGLAALAGSNAHAAEIAATIQIRPGVTESFLANLPEHPVAAAILFPESGPCDPLSYHGYFGVEGQAVTTITGFITGK